MTTRTTGWHAFADDLTAVDSFVGPFPHRQFLEAAVDAIDSDGDLIIYGSDDAAIALVADDTTVRFAGDESITDYHAPLGPGSRALMEHAFADLAGRRVDLDSLPDSSFELVTGALDAVGAVWRSEVHAATGVLDLPRSADDWLSSIGKKERHEVRRKRRRFEAEVGPIEIVPGRLESVDAFCDLHRTAPGDKGSFMTDRMQEYFGRLVESAGAIIHDLVCEGRTMASAFGFETEDAYYYYNSAFDSSVAKSSPGIVLLSSLIERQIHRGAVVFDFLKGAEAYKYRHGAEPRDLHRVVGRLP